MVAIKPKLGSIVGWWTKSLICQPSSFWEVSIVCPDMIDEPIASSLVFAPGVSPKLPTLRIKKPWVVFVGSSPKIFIVNSLLWPENETSSRINGRQKSFTAFIFLTSSGEILIRCPEVFKFGSETLRTRLICNWLIIAVDGNMSCKLALNQPLSVRSIIVENFSVASCWVRGPMQEVGLTTSWEKLGLPISRKKWVQQSIACLQFFGLVRAIISSAIQIILFIFLYFFAKGSDG